MLELVMMHRQKAKNASVYPTPRTYELGLHGLERTAPSWQASSARGGPGPVTLFGDFEPNTWAHGIYGSRMTCISGIDTRMLYHNAPQP
ncbi:hypothetical protein EMPG_09813 [Blastomyces silverae]|uniref:Uncharacterized protein n=1 Tax=Blastomyces silverae TaxID=2060906 RepID=A0A0H1BP01_9EURO|nr:hypothetical protein EMPG_09813 [Blastomyces silverae]